MCGAGCNASVSGGRQDRNVCGKPCGTENQRLQHDPFHISFQKYYQNIHDSLKTGGFSKGASLRTSMPKNYLFFRNNLTPAVTWRTPQCKIFSCVTLESGCPAKKRTGNLFKSCLMLRLRQFSNQTEEASLSSCAKSLHPLEAKIPYIVNLMI